MKIVCEDYVCYYFVMSDIVYILLLHIKIICLKIKEKKKETDTEKLIYNDFRRVHYCSKGAFIYDVRFLGRQVGQASSDFTK